VIGQWGKLFTPSTPFLMTPNSGAMIASNPVQSTTTKRRFRQRMILPGANSTDSLLLMFRLLKKQNYDITGLLLSRI
jgi:hypothetical protein